MAEEENRKLAGLEASLHKLQTESQEHKAAMAAELANAEQTMQQYRAACEKAMKEADELRTQVSVCAVLHPSFLASPLPSFLMFVEKGLDPPPPPPSIAFILACTHCSTTHTHTQKTRQPQLGHATDSAMQGQAASQKHAEVKHTCDLRDSDSLGLPSRLC